MPRGVYERKGKPKNGARPSWETSKPQPEITVTTREDGGPHAEIGEVRLRGKEEVAQSMLEGLAALEGATVMVVAPRLCTDCASFEAGDEKDAHGRLRGLCHFMPAAVSVHEGHHCRQWEGRS